MRIVIADDSYVRRERARDILERTGDVEVVGAAGSAAELVDAVRRLYPDAVLTDVHLRSDANARSDAHPRGPDAAAMRPSVMEGIEAAHAIKVEKAAVGILVLSSRADEAYAFELVKRGAAGLGYLLADRLAEPDRVVRALREVAGGGTVLDPLVIGMVVGRRARISESPLRDLGPRELDILGELAQGRSDAAIAHALRLAEPEVRDQVHALFGKLELVGDARPDRRVETVLTYLRDAGLAGDRDR